MDYNKEIEKYFDNDPYRYFIFLRTYSRWLVDESRRESWEEVVNRYVAFMKDNLGDKLSDSEYSEIQNAILYQKVMPSMRLMWSAGKAASKTNATAYNCSYVAPTKLQDFGEILYLLTCGCGVGFSCEQHVIDKLPMIEVQRKYKAEDIATFTVPDSREGWADALVTGMDYWYRGYDMNFDFSKIRPAGARLVTMGGRASGSAPLEGLLAFAKEKILARQGEKLRPIDVHDIICKIGDIVVMGGVRRSSEISLSDLGDRDMREAKMGAFYINEPQRSMANNSVAYKTKPTQQEFMEEWISLMKAGSGERGIFNRAGLEVQMPKRRWEKTGEHYYFMGSNPCGEITLRSKQFCNLTEIVARADDTEETLLEKMKIATILGTYQSSLTYLPYLSSEWKRNCDEERLLGVSITGQFDCPLIKPTLLRKLRKLAITINEEYAQKLGINPSQSITCVKPSGTVSQLVNASSGAHPRYATYYIRRVRIAATDPLFRLLKDQGVPYNPEVGQSESDATTYVLDFYIKAPENAVLRTELTAIDQLEYWKVLKENYTEHNPSTTIYVDDEEWLSVADWVYKNWDIIGGLSFLPKEKHVYKLAPYEEISESKYKEEVSKFPIIDFNKISQYELEDNTQGSQELACSSGACTIDITPEEMAKLMSDTANSAKGTLDLLK